jgi:hypothetical protein
MKLAAAWRTEDANHVGDRNCVAKHVAEPAANTFHDGGRDDRDLLVDNSGFRR